MTTDREQNLVVANRLIELARACGGCPDYIWLAKQILDCAGMLLARADLPAPRRPDLTDEDPAKMDHGEDVAITKPGGQP